MSLTSDEMLIPPPVNRVREELRRDEHKLFVKTPRSRDAAP